MVMIPPSSIVNKRPSENNLFIFLKAKLYIEVIFGKEC